MNISFINKTLPWALNRLRQPGLISRIVRGAGITLTVQVSGVFLAYVMQVLLARWMGTTEYGKYTYAFSWATVLSVVAGFGLKDSILRFIPEYTAKREAGLLRGVVQWSWRLTLGAGVFVSLLGCGAVAWLVKPEYITSLMLGVWMVPLIALMNLNTGVARAVGRVATAFVPLLVLRPFLIVGGVLALSFAHAQLNSEQVLIVSLAVLLILALFQGLILHGDFSSRLEVAQPKYCSRKWLRVAVPLLLSDGFQILIPQMGILMLGAITGPKEAGIYSVATKTAMFVGFVFVAVNALAAPMFVSLHARNEHDELQKLLVKTAHTIFWPSLAIAAALVMFSGLVLGLFGQEFLSARIAMIVLIVGQLVNAGTGAVGNLIDLTGYQRQGAWVRGCSTMLTVLLSIFLIPIYGILGAAIASASGVVLLNVWLNRLAVKDLHLRPSILFALSCLKASNE